MRILAVAAHPDDIESQCAGTLARYRAEGHEVAMCTVANGDCGSFGMSPTETAAIRRQEAEAAAAVIGATYETLDVGDCCVQSADSDQRRLVVDLVRRTMPDVIFTHSPDDYNGDHNEVSKLVFQCSWFATLGSFQPGPYAAVDVTPIYFMETVSGLGFLPTHFVDITSVFQEKREMLLAHKSQHTWLHEHDGVDVVGDMEVQARFRGIQCGVRYAEGFTECLTGRRVVARRVLP